MYDNIINKKKYIYIKSSTQKYERNEPNYRLIIERSLWRCGGKR